MEIISSKNGNSLCLFLAGRLDTITYPQLEEAIDQLPEEVEELILDCKDLEYISSAGLRVFMGAQKLMNRRGCMIVEHVSQEIMEIFEMTGFVDILNIQ